MNIIPSDKRLIIKQIKEEEKKNGIYMPDSMKKPSYFYEVVESASDLYKIGDKVMPQRHAGHLFEYELQPHSIVHEDEIIAKMKRG